MVSITESVVVVYCVVNVGHLRVATLERAGSVGPKYAPPPTSSSTSAASTSSLIVGVVRERRGPSANPAPSRSGRRPAAVLLHGRHDGLRESEME